MPMPISLPTIRLRLKRRHATSRKAPCIVLIDDDDDLRSTYHELLEPEGYTVHTLAEPFRHPADIARLQPDVIVLDLLFGGKPLGWEMLAVLRKYHKTAQVPVVLCTAAMRELEAYTRELGLDALAIPVVTKPFDIDTFLETIAPVCRLRAVHRI